MKLCSSVTSRLFNSGQRMPITKTDQIDDRTRAKQGGQKVRTRSENNVLRMLCPKSLLAQGSVSSSEYLLLDQYHSNNIPQTSFDLTRLSYKLQESATYKLKLIFHNGHRISRPNPYNRKHCHFRGRPRLHRMSREMRYSITRDWDHGVGSAASVRSHCGFRRKSSLPHLVS